jgi:hypothetical protein
VSPGETEEEPSVTAPGEGPKEGGVDKARRRGQREREGTRLTSGSYRNRTMSIFNVEDYTNMSC